MGTQVITRSNLIDPPPAIASLCSQPATSAASIQVPDWLDGAVQKAKVKYQRQRELEEILMQEETLKRKLGSQFCKELAGWLQAVEVRFNTRFGGAVLAVTVEEVKDSRTIRVLARPLRSRESMAELEYQNGTDYLKVNIGSAASAGTSRIVNFVVSGGAVLAEIGTDCYTWEQLGQRLIEDLLA